jgi:hypothetical protein
LSTVCQHISNCFERTYAWHSLPSRPETKHGYVSRHYWLEFWIIVLFICTRLHRTFLGGFVHFTAWIVLAQPVIENSKKLVQFPRQVLFEKDYWTDFWFLPLFEYSSGIYSAPSPILKQSIQHCNSSRWPITTVTKHYLSPQTPIISIWCDMRLHI